MYELLFTKGLRMMHIEYVIITNTHYETKLLMFLYISGGHSLKKHGVSAGKQMTKYRETYQPTSGIVSGHRY